MFVPAFQQTGAGGAPMFMQPGAPASQPQQNQQQQQQTATAQQPSSAYQAFMLNPADQAQHHSGIQPSTAPVGTSLSRLEPTAQLQQPQQFTGFIPAQTSTSNPATPGTDFGSVPAQEATQLAAERVPVVPCPPEVMNCTMHSLAASSLLSKTNIPLAAVVRPLAVASSQDADAVVPLIPFDKNGIVRCRSCRTYINPYVQFFDGGRRWKCNICGYANEVRAEYYSPLQPGTGQRRDMAERPELTHGCVEFCASTDYMSRAPMPPVFFFVIDVSGNAVATGLVASVAKGILDWIEGFGGHKRTRVGFVLYDSTVTFVNLRAPSQKPILQVCSDIEECENISALPPSRYEELVVNLIDNLNTVVRFLKDLPSMVAGNCDNGVAFQSAVSAGCQAIKPWGGRIISFVSGMPNVGNSALPPRGGDEFTKRGGMTAQQAMERESSLARALENDAGEFVKSIALDCSRRQCTVDVVLTGSRHQELATLAQLAQFTGGEVLHMNNFSAADTDDLARNLVSLLNRPAAWESVVRFRFTEGLSASEYWGNFFLRSTDLLVIPCADGGKSITVNLSVSGTPVAQSPGMSAGVGECLYVQVAYLYTSSNSERRIRVATMPIHIDYSPSGLYNSIDSDCLVAVLAKMAANKLLTSKITDARELLLERAVSILAAYRESGVAGRSSMLVMPPQMATLPLYILALLKSPLLAVAAPDIRPDIRAAAIANTRVMPVEHLLVTVHPQLFDLTPMMEDPTQAPPMLALTAQSINPTATYLLNCGNRILIYVGRAAGPQFLTLLFGVESRQDIRHRTFPRVDNDRSQAVWALIDSFIAARESAQLDIPPVYVTLDDRDIAQYLIADRNRNFYNYQEFVEKLQANVLKKM